MGMDACKSCGSAQLKRHCSASEAPLCNWIQCADCHSYGDKNGIKWYDMRPDVKKKKV
jgi:hypothetical protein